MGRVTKILIIAICIVIAGLSWFITVISKTPAEKQLDLIRQAQALTDKKIYISAVPLLEEAAGYDSKHTLKAEEELKKVYLALIGSSGFSRRYTDLLEKQMARQDASPAVFTEAAQYQFKRNSGYDALMILKAGIERTGDAGLAALYEGRRYDFEINRNIYEEVTAVYNDTIAVRQDGKWGIIKTDGSALIPCEYDKVSTYHQNRAIVKKGGEIYAVDSNNHRIAVAPPDATDFQNFSDSRTALFANGGWRRATWDFQYGTNVFDGIGMHSGGYAAAEVNGKWGVISVGGEWLIEAVFDEIMQDELGRCHGQGAVFAREGGCVYLYANGIKTGDVFDNARPFSEEGFAAVMKNGKWGFVDNQGNIAIDYMFDDARSFSGHLAAVKSGDLWGYASVSGDIVIDAVFTDAGSFAGGTAPVKTDKGWQLITLTEYKKTGRIF